MAESSWPFHDGVDGTPVLEDQWSYMARQWAATGVVGAPGDANLQVFANASGREVHVRAGRASVRGHWFLSTAQETLAIAANASGNPRIDRVVLRLDPSSDEVTLAVLTGTPAGSPSAPALTQTDTGVYELVLAQVAVANGAASISSGNVTDERTFTSVPYTVALSSLRPTAPVIGQRIWESDTGLSKVWNGSAWVNDNQSLHDAAAAVPHVRAWRVGNQGSLVAGVNTATYTDATYTDAALVPASGVVTIQRAGMYLLTGEIEMESTDMWFGFYTSRYGYIGRQSFAAGGYRSVEAVRWFDAGDTLSFRGSRATTPTWSNPTLTVTFLGTATLT